MQGRTVLVIAHRLSTVQDADQVLLIQDGQVHAQGAHQILYQESELYRNLVQKQMINQPIQDQQHKGKGKGKGK